jgi:hypothetical protein
VRYLRKFHPWYVERLGAGHAAQDALQRAEDLAAVREALAMLRDRALPALSGRFAF